MIRDRYVVSFILFFCAPPTPPYFRHYSHLTHPHPMEVLLDIEGSQQAITVPTTATIADVGSEAELLLGLQEGMYDVLPSSSSSSSSSSTEVTPLESDVRLCDVPDHTNLRIAVSARGLATQTLRTMNNIPMLAEEATLLTLYRKYTGFSQERAPEDGELAALLFTAIGEERVEEMELDMVSFLKGAAGEGNVVLTETLLQRGRLSLDANNDVMYHIFDADRTPSVEVLKLLLPHIDINALGDVDTTVLTMACEWGSLEQTPWEHNAVRGDNSDEGGENSVIRCEIASLFLENGAEVNRRDSEGRTTLFFAVRDTTLCTLLVSKGADIHLRDNNGTTVADAAAAAGFLPSLLYFLSLGGVVQNTTEREEVESRHHTAKTFLPDTAAHRATHQDAAECIKVLSGAGAPLNARTSHGSTPLHSAASWCSLNALRALKECGADPLLTDEKGWSVLHFAASAKHHLEECEQYEGALPDDEEQEEEEENASALPVVLVREVLSWGCLEVDVCDDKGRTPLYTLAGAAAQPYELDVVDALLEAGADALAKDNSGITPLKCAADGRCLAVLKRFADRNVPGADVLLEEAMKKRERKRKGGRR